VAGGIGGVKNLEFNNKEQLNISVSSLNVFGDGVILAYYFLCVGLYPSSVECSFKKTYKSQRFEGLIFLRLQLKNRRHPLCWIR
jgi:hypothetical protein